MINVPKKLQESARVKKLEKELEGMIFVTNNESSIKLYEILSALYKILSSRRRGKFSIASHYNNKYPQLKRGLIIRYLHMDKCPAEIWKTIKETNNHITFSLVSRMIYGYKMSTEKIVVLCNEIKSKQLTVTDAYKMLSNDFGRMRLQEFNDKITGYTMYSQNMHYYRALKQGLHSLQKISGIDLSKIPYNQYAKVIRETNTTKEMLEKIEEKLQYNYDKQQNERNKKCVKCKKAFFDVTPAKNRLYCDEHSRTVRSKGVK